MSINIDNTNTGKVTLKSPVSGVTDIIFPSTAGTSGQVLTTDGAGNLSFTTPSGGGGATSYTASVPTGSWTGTAPATQTVTVTGLLTTDSIILDLNLSSAAFSAVEGLQTAYALVYRAVPGTNQVVLYASETPATSFDIYVTVI